MVIGATVGAVIAVVAIVIGALNQSGTNTPAVQASPPSSSASAGGTTSAKPGSLGQTPSAGTVEWGSAGQLVVDFYSNPGGSWSLLTPAAQKVYGSEQALRQYWSSRTVDTFSDIDAPSRTNNADGSIDMRLGSLTVEGQTKQLMLRVISTGGKLLIDSDTRAAGTT
jgi:hypothetical protein